MNHGEVSEAEVTVAEGKRAQIELRIVRAFLTKLREQTVETVMTSPPGDLPNNERCIVLYNVAGDIIKHLKDIAENGEIAAQKIMMATVAEQEPEEQEDYYV